VGLPLTAGVQTFFALAAVVAGEMFRKTLRVIAIREQDAVRLRTRMHLILRRDGTIILEAGGPP
jgi:hypothetical protein